MRVILMLQIAIVIFGCSRDKSTTDYHLDENTFDNKTLEMIQKNMGMTLPDKSRGLHLFWKGYAVDPAFVAKVEIPEAAQDEVRNKLENIQNHDGSVTGSLTDKVTWWKPSGVEKVTRQFLHDGNYVFILFCKEGDRYVIYIEWIKI